MLIKNKTNLAQPVAGKIVRPWRSIIVPDSTKVNEKVFEIIGEKKEQPKVIPKIKNKIKNKEGEE